ncbi:hypothetical protein ACPV4Z_18735 [Vibrio aestuarianus]|uniref:hypothetical protein n=1 Tax=Vibrio aestuarianus TaxID=28171 RepID=UPI004068229F
MAVESSIPTLFDQVRSWAELIYFFSGILVVVIAGFGLWQIKLAKDQLSLTVTQLELTKQDIHSNMKIFKTQCHRAAVESAVIECRRFSDEIVHHSLDLEKYCKENEISYFKDVTITHTKSGFKIDTSAIKSEDVKKLQSAEHIINKYLNGMEAFALFFLSGVADEKIAFHTNGKTFVDMAEEGFKLFPICEVSEDEAKPIKALYFMWREKLEAQKMRIEKKKLEERLKEYNEKEIKPIGT